MTSNSKQTEVRLQARGTEESIVERKTKNGEENGKKEEQQEELGRGGSERNC